MFTRGNRSLAGVLALLVLGWWLVGSSQAAEPKRPNILWISCEDISPNLGCYGDPWASTPNLDRLAAQGARFTRAFVPAPVCAVMRCGVITGVYSCSIGGQHMRSRIIPPPHIKCFPEYLRRVGYWCTNRWKTDYQFESPPSAWDRNGRQHDDWRGRRPGQPFFCVINLTISHESQARHDPRFHEQLRRRLRPEQIHREEDAGRYLPPYIPNTPEARRNWAWYYDNISEMDRQVGEILRRLEEDGLADETIVVFWSDHGQGLPRGKRWLYDSGIHVPLIVRWPGKIAPGTVREDLVSLIDLAPTMLALAGVPVPDYMQGRVFLGPKTQPEPKYVFAHRDRMDETYDLFRCVRGRRFLYIRNFEPQRPYSQTIQYMDLMPAMQQWRRLAAADKLNAWQGLWFVPHKPVEELYDTQADPHNLHNLAGNPRYRHVLQEMRQALEKWQVEVGDLGMIPEPVLMHRMKPLGKVPTTAQPTVQQKRLPDGRVQITAQCPTPGSSIVWRSQRHTGDRWALYTGPVVVPAGERVQLKACRLGYYDSPAVTLQAGK